jgi:hypothetical protein
MVEERKTNDRNPPNGSLEAFFEAQRVIGHELEYLDLSA